MGITKTLPSATYDQNKYYNITANLDVRVYDGDKYYMWDAQDQYWKGHEWHNGGSQPTLSQGLAGATTSNDYAKSNADSRYWNEYYPGYGVSNPATHTSCKDLPNVNEMTWYAAKGEPRWDADELWITMGHLYKGGMWFKKKANISGFNPNTAEDGTDWRTNGNGRSWSISYTLPSAADANNYFYLPALGFYRFGTLFDVGGVGFYWSSSASPWRSDCAYGLYFRSGNVYVSDDRYRDSGVWAEALQ